MQDIFRYKDDGTDLVHRWISDVQWNYFPAKKRAKTAKLDKADVLLDLPGTKLAKGTVMI